MSVLRTDQTKNSRDIDEENMTRTLIVMISIVVALFGGAVSARDFGQFLGLDLHQRKWLCPGFTVGQSLADIDWDTQDRHYRVRLNRKWIDVPPLAAVMAPDRPGPGGVGVTVR